MIKSFILFLLVILNCNCNNVNLQINEPKEENKIHVNTHLRALLLGTNQEFDSSSVIETIVACLNTSRYETAHDVLSKNFDIDTIKVGGYWGIKFHNEYQFDNYKKYVVYRYNDFLKNIDENELQVELLRSALTQDTILYSLQSLEADCSSDSYQRNSVNINNTIESLKTLKAQIPSALRLDYLLANEYLLLNDTSVAFNIFNRLIKQNYYALPSLRKILSYLYNNNESLFKQYSVAFEHLYPNECNIYNIAINYTTMPEDAFKIGCDKCQLSKFQRDSVYSKVLLARYYFFNKKFDTANLLINAYLKGIKTEIFDSTALIEKGIFFDMKMRLLFIQHHYSEICIFIKTELDLNPIIVIDNNEELKAYIQKLYSGYINDDLKNFDIFFSSNFANCY